ncbi:hypothetical protein GEMRC1_007235 [Eukaryota sp. GEM-RC1]
MASGSSESDLIQRLQFQSSSTVGRSLASSTRYGRLSSMKSSSAIPPRKIPAINPSHSLNQSSQSLPPKQNISKSSSLDDFILFLKNNPKSTEFRYLLPKSNQFFNPYNLRIVHYSDIPSDSYFTISKKGVTQFTSMETEFVDLDTWIRQRRIFSELLKIPLFAKCTSWKTFQGWRKHVLYTKLQQNKQKLQTNLFMLNPHFHRCLVTTKTRCHEIKSYMFHSVTKDSIFTLEELAHNHNEMVKTVRTKISAIYDEIKDLLRGVCDHVIDDLVKTNRDECLVSGMLHKNSESKGAKHDVNIKGSGKKSVTVNGGRSLSYQEMATRRAECRRLMSFIRLVDYLIFDAIFSLMNHSVGALAARLSSTVQQEITNIAPELHQFQSLNPLFVVSGVVGPFNDTIELSPQSNEYLELLKEILEDYKTVLTNHHSLISSDEFVSFFRQDLGMAVNYPSSDHGATVLIAMIRESVEYRTFIKIIKDSINSMFVGVAGYLQSFEPFLATMKENLETDILSKTKEQLTLQFFTESLSKFKTQVEEIQNIPDSVNIAGAKLLLRPLKEAFEPPSVRSIQDLEHVLPSLAKEKNEVLISSLQSYSRALRDDCTSVLDFVKFLHVIKETSGLLEEFQTDYEEVRSFYHLIQEHGIEVSDMELAVFRNLSAELDEVTGSLDIAEGQKDEGIIKFSRELESLVKDLHSDVVDVSNLAQDPIISDPNADVPQVLYFLEDLHARAKDIEQLSKDYQTYANEFDMISDNPDEYEDVFSMLDDVTIKRSLWNCFNEWTGLTEDWLVADFDSIDTEQMQKQVTNYLKVATRAERSLAKNPVAEKFKKAVDVFKQTLPVIIDLRNEKLKFRHRQKIEEILGVKFPKDSSLSLGWLIEHGALKKSVEINAISVEATNEASLEALLKQVEEGWNEVDLELVSHRDSKDLYIIATVEDIVSQLEDSMQTLSTMRGSRFVTAIEDQNIFTAPDISKQLPEESKLFQKVDQSWREIMAQTRELPNALRICTSPGLHATFKKNNASLEKIQKALDNYLEKKRASFPRFYFLSNDELLEILSQSRNPEAVQPHLRKCFDAINKLRFVQEGTTTTITAMISAEGEEVPLPKLKARGDVCKWLNDVQGGMRDSLHKIFKYSIQEFVDLPLKEWLTTQPAQIIIGVAQIFWCKEITEALMKCSQSNGLLSATDALKKVFEHNSQFLHNLSEVVQSDISNLHREAIVSLITIYVHNRDIVEEMIEEGVQSVDDFGWAKRLRYYWNSEIDHCEIKQTNTSFVYGYEYLGCTGRLVITPLTDRCYITLTGALHNKLGGSPAGPAGTGKTETTKDLAKALGRLCVVFNCSEQIDCLMMERLFAGLVQAGAWTCLDEFNRIGLEVLSVVAQQVLTIRTAILSNSQTFEFGGCGRIPLNPNCGIFITMNPGYAGRTELPDNLQILFRPVAMMVPDYALISEITLTSEGFKKAKILSQKMVQLYKLSSEQLSQQDHYDFGMRAVKTSLRAAGSLKRLSPELSEEVLIYRALYVENSPKFTADDTALFLGLLSDLFPGIEVPDPDYMILEDAIQTVLTRRGLQVVDSQVKKIIQLRNTLGVRHGVMVVGPTMGGKSVVIRGLAESMTYLRQEKESLDEQYQVVKTHILNPKSITMGQLYGEVNPLTKDWKNGIVSGLVLSATQDESLDKHWVVFDGPVDALWIENMNTVLDDNKMLCLANGLRIKLSPTTSMVFEVEDLSVASPATISRCGMVYVDPIDIGWKPLATSWLDKQFPESSLHKCKEQVRELMTNFMDKVIDYAYDNGKFYIRVVPQTMVNSFCNLFSSLFSEESGVKVFFSPSEDETESEEAQREAHATYVHDIIELIFSFALVWSIGAILTEDVRPDFDSFLRDLLKDKFPVTSGSVFDYFINLKTAELHLWEEKVDDYSYDPNQPFFATVVPTVDTVRFNYMLETLNRIDAPVLFTGGSGVGKSIIVSNFLNTLSESSPVSSISFTFSAKTTANRTQDMLESKLEQKRKGVLGPAGIAKKAILFIDDLNMPRKEVYGAQPPIELLRQILDYNGFYDRDKGGWFATQHFSILSACAPPGGGRSEVTARMTRHFNQFVVPQPSDKNLSRIFGCLLSGYLAGKNFKKEICSLADSVISASIEMYSNVLKEMRPTPSKSHYTFNLRDLSKVVQGLTMVESSHCPDTDSLVKLWCHESMRVFHDRLTNNDDRLWFKKHLLELAKRHLSVFWEYEEVYEGETPLIFTDLLAPTGHDTKPYQQLKDNAKMLKILQDSLEDYNVSSSESEMDLVFSKMPYFTLLVSVEF